VKKFEKKNENIFYAPCNKNFSFKKYKLFVVNIIGTDKQEDTLELIKAANWIRNSANVN